MSRIYLIDVGSTFTKLAVADSDARRIVGMSLAPTTVAEGVQVGLENAISLLPPSLRTRRMEVAKACSSAAGGLKVVVVGLVPALTSEAARRVALNAGAKVVGCFSYTITRKELAQIEALQPDMLLLAGGTDGGDHETILANAESLAVSGVGCRYVVAGNKVVGEEAVELLERAGKDVVLTENVMPQVDVLNPEPARTAIREAFIQHIIKAKGIDKIESRASMLMPTPMAVLRAAELMGGGPSEPGPWNELMMVDVGGATTDVYSVCAGAPTEAAIVPKGLPEPFAKRTVEGDLGVRHNVESLLDLAGGRHEEVRLGSGKVMPFEDFAVQARRSTTPASRLPENEDDAGVDGFLGSVAVEEATQRHGGALEQAYTLNGPVHLLYGKDLRSVENIVGTGGPIVFGKDPGAVLSSALYSDRFPMSLRPRSATMWLDRDYLLYAIGLLAGIDPQLARDVAANHIVRI